MNYKEPKFVKQSVHSVAENHQINGRDAPIQPSNSNQRHQKKEDIPPFRPHMTMQEASNLRVHDKIDHRDSVGRFVFATVSEKQGTNLKIHYDGWSRKWDTWSDYSGEIHLFAVAGSISKRRAHRFQYLKKGDYVDINPIHHHPGWKGGEIRRLDQQSGQVQVAYTSTVGKHHLCWAHLDNELEIAEFTSKSGTLHLSQLDILQKGDAGIGHNQDRSQNVMGAAPMDEMGSFRRVRAKRFPLEPNEQITNEYQIGDWLEVQDTQTLHWIKATVIDRENNWIVVHFDGWPSKYDQKIHAVKDEKRLRDLGSELQEIEV